MNAAVFLFCLPGAAPGHWLHCRELVFVQLPLSKNKASGKEKQLNLQVIFVEAFSLTYSVMRRPGPKRLLEKYEKLLHIQINCFNC